MPAARQRAEAQLVLDVGDQVVDLGGRQVGEQLAHAAEAERLEPGATLG